MRTSSARIRLLIRGDEAFCVLVHRKGCRGRRSHRRASARSPRGQNRSGHCAQGSRGKGHSRKMGSTDEGAGYASRGQQVEPASWLLLASNPAGTSGFHFATSRDVCGRFQGTGRLRADDRTLINTCSRSQNARPIRSRTACRCRSS